MEKKSWELSTFSGKMSTFSGKCQPFQENDCQPFQEKGKKLSTKIRKRQPKDSFEKFGNVGIIAYFCRRS
jgi:hypothetical protein